MPVDEAVRNQLTPQKVVADYRAHKLEKANSSREPSASNRCSELGHPCTAYLYFARTVPAELRPPISEDLAEIFDEGKKQERAIQADLLEMGYDIKRQQESLRWPQYNITGHKDFEISKNGSEWVDCEFKSVNPYTYEKLNSPEDVRESKAAWTQKWYGQTVLYMLLKGKKQYWLLLKNKSKGSIKPIAFSWNDQVWQDAEALVQKAEKVNGLVQIGQMPSADLKIDNPDECARCQFVTVCLPGMSFGPGAQILTDEVADELAGMSNRREELKPLADEFEELDGEIKARIKSVCPDGATAVVYGEWIANVKRIEKKAYTVKAQTQTQVKLIRATPAAAGPEDEGYRSRNFDPK